MQRKNYFLKTSCGVRKSRNAMAMIMAIIVVLVIATVMSLSLALTVQTSKRTTDMYLYEQSVLVSQSAAEYAMLRISQTTPQCSLPSLNYTYNGIYDINTTMRYISNAGTQCANNAGTTLGTVTYTKVIGATTYFPSDGSVMLDITVTANPAGTTEPIRYFRRSIQKM